MDYLSLQVWVARDGKVQCVTTWGTSLTTVHAMRGALRATGGALGSETAVSAERDTPFPEVLAFSVH